MLAIASDGYVYSSSELVLIETLTRCEIVRIKGGHHFHMEESAQYLSQIIDDFLAR